MFDTEPSPFAVHTYGAISTANAGPGTNGEQFFIVNTAETPWLNGNHTVFGHTVRGFEVLDAVSAVATGADNRPLEEVVIESVRIGVYGVSDNGDNGGTEE
jgi:cyclophilin family peptidyl-prolyl cis-trans isomerase